MASSGDYLDRLRNIRQKYGCSQNKTSSPYADQYLGVQRTNPIERPAAYDRTGSNYYKADLYSIEKAKLSEQALAPSMTGLGTRAHEYAARPQSSAGLSSNYAASSNDFSRRAERQREIDQIRENYAASRKRVIEDYSAKSYLKDMPKEIPRDYPKDYSKDYSKDYLKEYSRQRRDDTRQNEYPIAATKIDLLGRREQSVSPIKIMSDYEDKKSYRQRELDAAPDSFWRQREAKLSELTSNRLNENKTIFRDDKLLDHKFQTKLSGIYGVDKLKSYQPQGISRMDLQNKANDYSVNNIDRIQQRIQSILGGKK